MITPAAPPEPRSTPAFAAAPHGSMGRHEAMALAGPTPDNPFATLAKRLKRARFLDQQERQAYEDTLAGQKDLRFSLTLKNVGTFLDLTSRSSAQEP